MAVSWLILSEISRLILADKKRGGGRKKLRLMVQPQQVIAFPRLLPNATQFTINASFNITLRTNIKKKKKQE